MIQRKVVRNQLFHRFKRIGLLRDTYPLCGEGQLLNHRRYELAGHIPSAHFHYLWTLSNDGT